MYNKIRELSIPFSELDNLDNSQIVLDNIAVWAAHIQIIIIRFRNVHGTLLNSINRIAPLTTMHIASKSYVIDLFVEQTIAVGIQFHEINLCLLITPCPRATFLNARAQSPLNKMQLRGRRSGYATEGECTFASPLGRRPSPG